MITLKRGDHLPTVAVIQSFLSQFLDGASVAVDGVYGPKTEAAVVQARRAMGIGHSGVVDGQFWLSVVGREWQVIDSVSVLDSEEELDALQPWGQTVRAQYPQSRGADQVLGDLRASARAGKVALIRFHGHGAPGGMIVAAGKHNNGSIMQFNIPSFFESGLRNLRGVLGPFASVEMHGCRVAQGPNGLALLTKMAGLLGVPVTASPRSQLGGGSASYRFEGPTRTVCPGGGSIRDWAARVLTVSRPKAMQSI
jgi:hypothetical protein